MFEQGVVITASGVLGIPFAGEGGPVFSLLKDETLIAQTSPGESGDPRKQVLEKYRSILAGSWV